MVYVITEDSNFFIKFCNKYRIATQSPNFRPLVSSQQLRGMIDVPIILYGNYTSHWDWDDISQVLPSRNPIYLTVDNK